MADEKKHQTVTWSPDYVSSQPPGVPAAMAVLNATTVNADVLAALEAVARAAETPDCNYNTERECGFVNGVYKHHPEWCPRGRLDAALAKLAEVRGHG